MEKQAYEYLFKKTDITFGDVRKKEVAFKEMEKAFEKLDGEMKAKCIELDQIKLTTEKAQK